MEKDEALERIEFRVRHSCPEASGDNIGDCDKCWRYPCNDMKALLTLSDRKIITHKDIFNSFKTIFPYVQIDDYRPTSRDLVEGKVGITVYLKNKDIVVYYPNMEEGDEE